MADEKQETIADIVRKMRNEIAELRKVSPNVPSIAADWWEARADEIEAAHKRDIDRELDKLWKRIGNKTKLREAVERCLAVLKRIDWLGDGVFPNGKFVSPELLARAIQEADAALAAPPRNCDVGTADEQVERWNNENPYPCKWDDKQYFDARAMLEWAQMPYEEGGAK